MPGTARRGLLAALLLVAAAPAAAEWLKLDEHAGAFLYYDPETVAKEGVIRRLFTLQDRKSPDNGVLSRRAQWEFNCKESEVRLLAFRSYADQMGIGKVLTRTDNPGPWEPVVPRTTHETLLRLACAR